MMRKRTIALILSVFAVIFLGACGAAPDDGAAETPAASPGASASPAPSASASPAPSTSASPAPGASPGPSVSAQPAETPAQKDYRADYEAILADYCELIAEPEGKTDFDPGEQGVYQAAQAMGDEAVNKLGFVMTDLNDDGTAELLVGVFDKDVSAYTRNEVYAAYTHDGEGARLIFESGNRSYYTLLDGGTIYVSGSNGAMYAIFGEYEVSGGGELVCKDYYFTHEKGADQNELGFFHNTDGQWDVKVSEELDVSEDEFWQIEGELAARSAEIRHTRLCDLGVE